MLDGEKRAVSPHEDLSNVIGSIIPATRDFVLVKALFTPGSLRHSYRARCALDMPGYPNVYLWTKALKRVSSVIVAPTVVATV
jgi:hypothetical protein